MSRYRWTPLLVIAGLIAGAAQAESTFTEPRNGETVGHRKSFTAAVDIEDYSSAGKYWVAIASVTGHERTWDRVLELREQVMTADDRAARSELIELIGDWPLDQFWPKFFVKSNPYKAQVFDGGTNPLSEPQPMVLLLLKVDDSLQEYISGWFKDKDYPGIPATRLRRGMILARSEIFFP